MGLRDLFDNVRYGGASELLKELGEIVRDASKEFGQLKQEGRELFSDGFREMVLKGKADYKTSFEKNADAGKIIQQAIVKCKKAEDKLRDKTGSLSEQVLAHHQHIDAIMRGPIATWHERSRAWGDIRLNEFVLQKKLDLRAISLAPKYNAAKKLRAPRRFDVAKAAPTGRNAECYWPDIPGLPPLMFLNYAGIMAGLEQRARVKAASAFLEDAKDFRLEVKKHVAEIRDTELKMLAVSHRIAESERLISEFESNLRKLLPRIRPSKVSGLLSAKGLGLARISTLIVSAIITLSKDALLDPSDDSFGRNSNLRSDLKQLNKLVESLI